MGQLRKKAKALSERVREGDVDAAHELLKHSIRLGHSKLALRRLFLAQAMGAAVADEHLRYCAAISAQLKNTVRRAMAEEERCKAQRYLERKKTDG